MSMSCALLSILLLQAIASAASSTLGRGQATQQVQTPQRGRALQGSMGKVGDGVCRTEEGNNGQSDNQNTNTLQECMSLCEAAQDCLAIEYTVGSGKCEVHKEEMTKVEERNGVECYSKGGGFSFGSPLGFSGSGSFSLGLKMGTTAVTALASILLWVKYAVSLVMQGRSSYKASSLGGGGQALLADQEIAAQPSLPAGWDEKVDPNSGRSYYVYASTGQNQWERPATSVVQSQESPLDLQTKAHRWRGVVDSDKENLPMSLLAIWASSMSASVSIVHAVLVFIFVVARVLHTALYNNVKLRVRLWATGMICTLLITINGLMGLF